MNDTGGNVIASHITDPDALVGSYDELHREVRSLRKDVQRSERLLIALLRRAGEAVYIPVRELEEDMDGLFCICEGTNPRTGDLMFWVRHVPARPGSAEPGSDG